MNFLKRLFGLKQSAANSPTAQPVRAPAPQPARTPSTAQAGPRSREITGRYYETMTAMQTAWSRGDFDAAAKAVRDNLKVMAGWAKATHREYGAFDISSIPTIERGATILALMGDDAGLAEMRAIVAQNPELSPWAEQVEQGAKDRALFQAVMAAVNAAPGCLQTDVRVQLGEPDGARIGLLTGQLERAGRLARIRSGKTYKLVPPGSPEIPAPPARREVASHRTDHTRPLLREIDIAKLEYVPLPRSPLKWEETQAGRERAKVAPATEPFEIRDAAWQVVKTEKIPPGERPDPAFRLTHPCATGLVLIDDLGKAEGLGSIPASALRYDRNGRVTVKAALLNNVYRLGVHPMGHGFIAMSREAALHAYDDDLKPILETALPLAPEIVAIRKRFDISDDELKNHIRCVALSRDAARYLFTCIDEAWCVSADGKGIWGVKLPLKEGWSRIATPSGGAGTSVEIDRALTLMELKLPVTPDELKSRYRSLAKKWHPDLNPGDPNAGERMAALNAATEILTGIDATSLPSYTGARFGQELHRSTIEAGGMTFTVTMGIQVSEKYASDWIYAASFAGASDTVYLAGYSGRVVLVDGNGAGVRVYDLGTVPRQIVDTGRYLYLLTGTRLYVLRNDALHAVIDTFDGGDLVVAQNGFGLLEKKRLRWYSAAGSYLGSVVTKDPIRRVYFAMGQMIVETRQSRAAIDGVASWWNEANTKDGLV